MAGEDRTQQATPRRRQEARKHGQVVRSRELTAALSLLAVVFLFGYRPGVWVGPWRGLLVGALASARAENLTPLTGVLGSMSSAMLRWLWPPLALLWGVALLSSVAQGGIVFAPELIQPNWERLNPVANLGSLFSLAGLSRMLKSLLPAALILWIGLSMAQRDWTSMVSSSRAGIQPLMGWMFTRWFELSWKCGLVLLGWAMADYFLQRRHFENSLRMSRQEVRQETKDAEGSPVVRGRIRQRRKEMRKRWKMKDVERATAVIANPEHFAVALEYRPQSMPAPIVLAKGVGRMAQRIKEVARWHDIPIVENPPLAQALYRATEVGQAIPAKLYAAVAEILAFLYRTQARLRAAANAPRPATGPARGRN